MTISFYRNHASCSEQAQRVNLFLYGGQAITRCLRVRVSDLRKADRCGIRDMGQQTVRQGSTGYVVGRGIRDFSRCGLILTKKPRY